MQDGQDRDAAAVAGFALARCAQAGAPRWLVACWRQRPESVAEHSLRVAQFATMLAVMEGADPARAAFLALWHDSQETRTGDLPQTAKPYVQLTDNERITTDQTAQLSDATRKVVQEAVTEYETRATPEAHCARDADKLECLFEALEYRAAGYVGVKAGPTPHEAPSVPDQANESPIKRCVHPR